MGETLALCAHQIPIKFGCTKCEKGEIDLRLERLEEVLGAYLKPNTREDIDRLEQRFKCIELRLSELKIQSGSKAPYRCPVCGGKGIVPHAVLASLDCFTCKGSGVVWG